MRNTATKLNETSKSQFWNKNSGYGFSVPENGFVVWFATFSNFITNYLWTKCLTWTWWLDFNNYPNSWCRYNTFRRSALADAKPWKRKI